MNNIRNIYLVSRCFLMLPILLVLIFGICHRDKFFFPSPWESLLFWFIAFTAFMISIGYIYVIYLIWKSKKPRKSIKRSRTIPEEKQMFKKIKVIVMTNKKAKTHRRLKAIFLLTGFLTLIIYLFCPDKMFFFPSNFFPPVPVVLVGLITLFLQGLGLFLFKKASKEKGWEKK